MKRKVITLFVMSLLSISSFAQLGSWPLPPSEIDFTLSGPMGYSIPNGYNGLYYGSEAAYDPSGNMLFYTIFSMNDFGDGQRLVYQPGNYNLIGELNAMSGGGAYWHKPGEQSIITTIPGETLKFYIIYSVSGVLSGGKLAYATVDFSGGAVNITNHGIALGYSDIFSGKALVEINGNKYIYVSTYGVYPGI